MSPERTSDDPLRIPLIDFDVDARHRPKPVFSDVVEAETMARTAFLVDPANALSERRRLFDAVGRLYDADFVDERSRAPDIAGRIQFGGMRSDAERDRLPSLVLFNGDRERAAVVFHQAPSVPRAFRGRTLEDSTVAVLPSGIAAGLTSVLARTESGPVWASLSETLELAAPAPAELETNTTLRSRFRPGRFSDLLPLLAFVSRNAAADWQQPQQSAAFLIDDPNLRAMRYGFVHFDQLAVDARDNGYHVAFATIPLDLWWASRRVVRLFRESSHLLSLLIHGNDHRFRELDRDQSDRQRIEMLSEALQRVDRFERRYAVPVARVMAPPHGACAHATISTLLRLNFEALCISRTYPWLPGGSHNDVLAGSRPVHLVDGEFPLLLRHHIGRDRDDLLFRAFLGQPLIIYGHHEDLVGGVEVLRDTAAFINDLSPVEWLPLDGIARSRFSKRRNGSCLVIRPQTRHLEVPVDGTFDTIAVELSHTGPTGTVVVTRDGESLSGPGPHSVAGDRVKISIRPGTAMDPSNMATRSNLHSMWPFVRRLLTEGRDRLAPSATALRVRGEGRKSMSADPLW